MNKELSYQVKAAQKLLVKAGLSFRLSTMREKRDGARAYKKRDYLPWDKQEKQELRDIRDNFKKDVWVVFSGARLIGFWSSRRLIKYARQLGEDARHAKSWNTKNVRYKKPNQIVVEPPLEDSDFYASDERYFHFCSNCPENIDWREYKAQNNLTNE